MLYIFFHHAGQFLNIDTRNSQIKNPLSFDGTVYLNLDLLVSHSISTSSNPCDTNAEAYDLCIQNQNLDLLLRTNSCYLPFLKQQHYKSLPLCETLESGFKTLALFQQTSFSCLTPCLLFYAELMLQSEDKYITNSLTRYAFMNKNIAERSGLFIHLPKDVNLIESKFDNSLFSSIANFLGVAVLFFEISAFSCFEATKDFLCLTANVINVKIRTHKYVKVIFFVAFILVCSVLIISILVVFISRYTSSPTETYVSLQAELPNISLSFCSSSNTAELVNKKISMGDAADIRKQLSNVLIMNSAGKWSTVWNSSIPKTQDKFIFRSFIFPLNTQTIQFCQTFDLQSYPGLTKVRVTAP